LHTSNRIQGHLSLSEACPVCQHSPVSAGDCKPHKNLRQTISAYLKSEARKREKAKKAALTVPAEVAILKPEDDDISAKASAVEEDKTVTTVDRQSTSGNATAGALEGDNVSLVIA
jgi:hypothetical protein